jgi:hypothetical protein
MAASIPVNLVRVPAAAGGREVRRGLRDLPTVGALVAVVVGASSTVAEVPPRR